MGIFQNHWIKRGLGLLAIILAFLISNSFIQSYNLPNIAIKVVTAQLNSSINATSNSSNQSTHTVRVIVRVSKMVNNALYPLQNFQIEAYKVNFLENSNKSILTLFSSRLTNRYGYAILPLPIGEYVLRAFKDYHQLDDVKIKLNASDKEIFVNLIIHESIVKPLIIRFYDIFGEEGVMEFGDYLEAWYPFINVKKLQLVLLNLNDKVEVKMFVKELKELNNISYISLSPIKPFPLSEIRNIDSIKLLLYKYEVEVFKRS
ncbi:MAG: hypothetical protein QW372_06300 [Nitrososphaerales archaeon]